MRCHPCFEEGKLREWRQSSKWTQSVKLPLSLLNQTKLHHEFTACVDKRRDILTSDFKLAEVLWSTKFKSARTRPLLVSKKSFRFPRKKRNESWSAVSSLGFRGKPDDFLRTETLLTLFRSVLLCHFLWRYRCRCSGVKPAEKLQSDKLSLLIGAATLLFLWYEESVS